MENSGAPDRRRLRGAILLALALDAGLWGMGYLSLGRGGVAAASAGPPVLVLTLEDPPGSPRGPELPGPAPKPGTPKVTAPAPVAGPKAAAPALRPAPARLTEQVPAPPAQTPTPAARTESGGAPPVSAKSPVLAVSSVSQEPTVALSGPPTGDVSAPSVPEALAKSSVGSASSALAEPSELSGARVPVELTGARFPVQGDTPREPSRETLYRILNRLIQERLTYPPLAKQRNIQGVVGLTLVVSPEGKLLSLKLGQSSQSSILDRAAKTLVETLFPLSDPPALGTNQTLLIQVRYVLTL